MFDPTQGIVNPEGGFDPAIGIVPGTGGFYPVTSAGFEGLTLPSTERTFIIKPSGREELPAAPETWEDAHGQGR